jgi:hypothetical protein
MNDGSDEIGRDMGDGDVLHEHGEKRDCNCGPACPAPTRPKATMKG